MAFINIKYNDGDGSTYKAVEISHGEELKKKKVFKSGNFVKDWYDAMKFVIFKAKESRCSMSSSVNHFIIDGAPYESAYLIEIEKDKWDLRYVDETDPLYLITQRDIYEKGIEFFVNTGTKPTWTELKELCGEPKKKQ